jgi:hypothetical protein
MKRGIFVELVPDPTCFQDWFAWHSVVLDRSQTGSNIRFVRAFWVTIQRRKRYDYDGFTYEYKEKGT